MKICIDVTGYATSQGFADQITLPNGKFIFAEPGSIISFVASKKNLDKKRVEYFGACIASTINERSHWGFPIQIEKNLVSNYLEQIATEDELMQFILEISSTSFIRQIF